VSLDRHRYKTATLVTLLLMGCRVPIGEPAKGSEVPAPNEVVQFSTLYLENCSGCHGAEGRGGAAIGLADPVYLAIADDESIRKAISDGVPGTSMPAFAQSAGGMLTDEQIGVIVTKIRSQWSRPGILDGVNPPSHAAKSFGDRVRGQAAYNTYCSSCHGPEGRGTARGSAVTDRSFLALISDQGLRTIIITGRPELRAPDWRGDVPGKPMSDQEVTDVVAWLASKRTQDPGQSASNLNDTQR